MYKKSFILLTLLFTLLLINPLNIKAEELTKPDTKGVITVTGMASENFPPDTAIIILAIETIAKNARDAAINNSRKTDKVIGTMKQLIKPEIGDTIKTSSFILQPVYEYDNAKKRNILTGYSSSNQLTITTKQIKNVGIFLDSAIANGANQIKSLNFQLKKNDEYCKRLLAKATDNAKEQASIIAQTLGVKISGIKQVRGSCGSEQSYPRMYATKSLFTESSEPSTPIESGEIKINATVNADFYVNQHQI
ncbi:MAG: SIMPL domain-containing protein [Candidatus Gastranaerophilales bacterium]|nr:SIMPL domain-containing protein [Candidatus Gastranaerophilales bacterium]